MRNRSLILIIAIMVLIGCKPRTKSSLELKTTDSSKTTTKGLTMPDVGDLKNNTSNNNNNTNTSVSSWSKEYRNKFLQGCIGKASEKVSAVDAFSYCNCMTEKVEAKYPNENEVDAKLTAADWQSLMPGCLTSSTQSNSSNNQTNRKLVAQVTDKDGNSYNTVHIGSQVWMDANLNVSHFHNGDIIPEAEGADEWEKAGNEGRPAWCYYGNNPVNGRTYKKLYNWYAVDDPRGLAPNGWHVPSTLEWAALSDYLGGEGVGDKIKSTSGWESNGNGTNVSGFAGLPGGGRANNGTFANVGNYGAWWSSTEYDTTYAWSRYLNYANGNVNRSSYNKQNGFSVRCLR